jgi:hypothetical protein
LDPNTKSKSVFLKQFDSEKKKIGSIHSENLDRGAPAGRPSQQMSAVKVKMLVPEIGSRMEQANEFPGLRIQPGDVRTFETIAMEASECKIFAYCCPSVLAGDDVIDLKRESVVRMWDSTVFTPISCSFPNLPKQLLVH